MAQASNRDLIDVDDRSCEEIAKIVESAKSFADFAKRDIKKAPALRGKTIVNLFFEPSTRTRLSFEVAAKRLSADVMNFTSQTSSITKGESIKDTALALEAMGSDAVVIRHSVSGVPVQLSRWIKSPVINAGDGMHAHPTQALLDLYTLKDRLKADDLTGLRIAVVGDVLHSRVARSGIKLWKMMGCEVSVAAPSTLIPEGLDTFGVAVADSLDDIVGSCDVYYMLRLQKERQKEGHIPALREYRKLFCFDRSRLKAAGSNAVIMHPGPMNRGIEIESEVADSHQCLVTEQVESGVAVRMAVLFSILVGDDG